MHWRLLLDSPGGAARNMAVDEALYLSARESLQATVRFYAFDQPTVSLGYRQKLADAVDEEACRRNGVELVRRITGGWALLHHHELTWSVAAPTRVGAFRALSVRDAYRRVNGVIRRACEELGVRLDPETHSSVNVPTRATAQVRSRSVDAALPCLAAPSPHEITVSGRKLVPSAQRRHRESLLQHGSVLFQVDEALWNRIRPAGHASGLSAVGLAEILPHRPSWDRLVEELRRSFSFFFEEEGATSELDADEQAAVEKLERKYGARSHLLSSGYIDNSEAVW